MDIRFTKEVSKNLTLHIEDDFDMGKKVANCVCLFGYGRTSRVPVDVWIAKAIETECRGEDIFEGFGEDAGIIQQYIFYYERLSHRSF